MTTFHVPDMSCGHCAATITRAVRAVDPAAVVAVDLPTHRVTVTGGQADAGRLSEVIAQAGYTPAPVAAA